MFSKERNLYQLRRALRAADREFRDAMSKAGPLEEIDVKARWYAEALRQYRLALVACGDIAPGNGPILKFTPKTAVEACPPSGKPMRRLA